MSIHLTQFSHCPTALQSCNISLEDRIRSPIARGDETSVLALMEDHKFTKISTKVLEWSLYSASIQGHLGTLHALLKCTKFDSIDIDFLEKILRDVSKQGLLEVVNIFIAHKSFHNIRADVLGEILIDTLEMDHLNVVRALMKDSRSNEIDAKHLRKILMNALEKNSLDIAHATIKCKEFSKILDCYKIHDFGSLNSLIELLEKIVKKGGLDIVQAITEREEFEEESHQNVFVRALGHIS